MNREHDQHSLPEVAALLCELPPDESLEDRTVSELRRHRLLHHSRGRGPRLWQIAAGVTLLVGGIALGRASTPQANVTPTMSGQRFLLLLHGGPTGLTEPEEARVVEEYGAWAVRLRGEGRFVSGERLGDAVAILPTAPLEELEELRGFFLISAASFDDAVQVAGACPHARRGGHVVVRPIDPT